MVRRRNKTLPGNPEVRSMGYCFDIAKLFLSFIKRCAPKGALPSGTKTSNSMDPLDAGTKPRQLLLDPLVATI